MKTSHNIEIRIAQIEDLPALVEIYNQAILTGGVTAHLTTFQAKERNKWFKNHTPNQYPILVAAQNTTVVGYASISPYREGRKGLEPTIELSYYIHSDHHRKGIGYSLLKAGLETAKKLNYKNVFCVLLASNEASASLLDIFNFKLWARLPKVARINGEYFDHLYFGREI